MSSQENFPDSHNAISSPESGCGPSPSGRPGGRMKGQSIQGRHPAKTYQLSASAPDSKGNAISGRNGCEFSGSFSLQQSLANRLRARLAGRGSGLFRLTWKESATPSGLLICRLRASADPATGRVFGLWPTAKATDGVGGRGLRKGVTITGRLPNGKKASMGLVEVAKFSFRGLANTVRCAASGGILTSFSVPTENGGALNRDHSRWAQGIPSIWRSCAPTEMGSHQKWAPSS